jgi:hypothetical protein
MVSGAASASLTTLGSSLATWSGVIAAMCSRVSFGGSPGPPPAGAPDGGGGGGGAVDQVGRSRSRAVSSAVLTAAASLRVDAVLLEQVERVAGVLELQVAGGALERCALVGPRLLASRRSARAFFCSASSFQRPCSSASLRSRSASCVLGGLGAPLGLLGAPAHLCERTVPVGLGGPAPVPGRGRRRCELGVDLGRSSRGAARGWLSVGHGGPLSRAVRCCPGATWGRCGGWACQRSRLARARPRSAAKMGCRGEGSGRAARSARRRDRAPGCRRGCAAAPRRPARRSSRGAAPRSPVWRLMTSACTAVTTGRSSRDSSRAAMSPNSTAAARLERRHGRSHPRSVGRLGELQHH